MFSIILRKPFDGWRKLSENSLFLAEFNATKIQPSSQKNWKSKFLSENSEKTFLSSIKILTDAASHSKVLYRKPAPKNFPKLEANTCDRELL